MSRGAAASASDRGRGQVTASCLPGAGRARRPPASSELSQGQRQLVVRRPGAGGQPGCCCSTSRRPVSTARRACGWPSACAACATRGVTILLVDHDMSLVLKVCDSITCWTSAASSRTGPPTRSAMNEQRVHAPIWARPTARWPTMSEQARRAPRERTTVDTGRMTSRRCSSVAGSARLRQPDGRPQHHSRVRPGVLAVLGPNGAGKTTLLMTLAGFLAPRAASRAARRRAAGVLAAADEPGRHGAGARQPGAVHRAHPGAEPAAGRQAGRPRDQVLDLFPALRRRGKLRVGDLSGGEQQMLAHRPGARAVPEGAPDRRDEHGARPGRRRGADARHPPGRGRERRVGDWSSSTFNWRSRWRTRPWYWCTATSHCPVPPRSTAPISARSRLPT